MVFNSFEYAVFLPLVIALYRPLGLRNQNRLLLVASYVFYGFFDWRFLGLMWLSTLVDYQVGRALAREADDARRRRIFLVSLVVNLGILGFFKYANFFSASANEFLGRVGLHGDFPTLRVLLPIGISFYTFHGISYTFDVYRRHIRPANGLLTFACFVAYFPQLVAGPIGRAHVQLPQIERPRPKPTRDDVRSALFLVLLGLFKKVAIADALAPFVNEAFGRAHSASGPSLLIGVYCFALQIYGDFSGYTDIARGSSRLFGIELLNNFDQPYLSRSVTEFWRRWHISLSNWLRDYLYIPLGGNRRGEGAMYRNLMITMVLGGLWHGAAWTFVVWGALHGAFLVVERVRGIDRGASREPTAWRWRTDLVPTLVTFHLVSLAWVFFRAASFGEAFDVVRGIVTWRGGAVDSDAVVLLVLAAVAVITIDLIQRNGRSEAAVLRWPSAARGLAFGSMLVPILVFSGGTPVQFIYFQF